jgi:hypothetical protein
VVGVGLDHESLVQLRSAIETHAAACVADAADRETQEARDGYCKLYEKHWRGKALEAQLKAQAQAPEPEPEPEPEAEVQAEPVAVRWRPLASIFGSHPEAFVAGTSGVSPPLSVCVSVAWYCL